MIQLVELSALIRLIQAVQGGEALEDALQEQAKFAQSAIKAPRQRTELHVPKRRKVDRTGPCNLSSEEFVDDDEEVVDQVHLLEDSLGERGPDTAAPTAWEAIRGLEEALDGLDHRQTGAASEVDSLGAIGASKSYARDVVRAGMAQVTRPLLDRVKVLEAHSQGAGSSPGGAAYVEETRQGLINTRLALADTRKTWQTSSSQKVWGCRWASRLWWPGWSTRSRRWSSE